jgi:FixJ family two-component response regulator
MSESIKQSKGEIVISDTREVVLKRATLIRRGLELINDLDNRQIEVHDKNRKRILFVDDDGLLVEACSRTLKDQCGYDCDGICFNGSVYELMEQVDSTVYDILIIGIVMPGFNGLELTKMIRHKGLYVPIILITGFTVPPIALESMKSGADDLIIKPFGVDELTSSMESVLKQRGLRIKNRNRDYQMYTELKFEDMSHTQDSDLHGLVRDYYETGELMAESTYKEGKLYGVSKVYHRWGTLLFEGSFRNGLADGRCKWFTAKGQVYIEENYKNGDRLRRNNYDNTGKVQQDIL